MRYLANTKYVAYKINTQFLKAVTIQKNWFWKVIYSKCKMGIDSNLAISSRLQLPFLRLALKYLLTQVWVQPFLVLLYHVLDRSHLWHQWKQSLSYSYCLFLKSNQNETLEVLLFLFCVIWEMLCKFHKVHNWRKCIYITIIFHVVVFKYLHIATLTKSLFKKTYLFMTFPSFLHI